MNEHRFSGKSAVYAVHRPRYPDALFDALFADGTFHAGGTVADVGAGTGLFSEGWLVRSCRVFAVEPDDAMRAEAVARLGANPDFHALAGSAEALPLPDGSVDAVVAGQAFHWFDRARFRAECRRLLRPDAPVVLAWNDRVRDHPAVLALAEANRKHCPDFTGFSGGWTTTARDFAGFFRDDRFDTMEFPFAVEQTEDEFVGRALSSSYAPRVDGDAASGYIDALRDVFQRFAHGPHLRTPMVCRAYRGRV